MITIENACEIAAEIFKSKFNTDKIKYLKDCGDKWFVSVLTDKVYYGPIESFFISKNDGEISLVGWDDETDELLDKSPDIDIPMMYR